MARARLVRLLLIGGAVALLLIAFGLLPGFTFLTDLARPPSLIVNDTHDPVLLAHCATACPAAGGEQLAPGAELRSGPPGSRWVVRDRSGQELGCLTATSGGGRLPVSRARPCA